MERSQDLGDDPGRPDHAAGPEQEESGFAEGQESPVRTPEEEEVGEFSEGQEDLPDDPGEERIGRFSDGEEAEPETVEKNLEGSFASGQEVHPEDRYEEAEEVATVREAANEEAAGTLGGTTRRDPDDGEPGAVRAG